MATEAPPAHAPGHPAEPIERDRVYVGGEWVEPAGSGSIEVLDSTTEQVIGRVPEGTPEDVDRAVTAARAGFQAWSAVPFEARLDALQGIAAGLAARGDELAALIAAEVGMPLAQSRTIQAGLPAMDFGGTAQVAREVVWEEQVGNSLVVREPIGVVGGDHPLELPAAPALREGRPGARGRLLGGGQAQRGDAPERLRAGRDHRRAGAARGRLQPRHRLRPGGRGRDRRPRRRRHGLLHRLHPRRAGWSPRRRPRT